MKTVVFGIFAHPDDEANLPSGTLIKYVQSGADLYLICATRGENGENPDGVTDLGRVREQEWLLSGKLIGAKDQLQLGYPDGGLSNSLFRDICEKIERYMNEVLDSYDEPVEVTFVTYEQGGVTGHIDHIVMNRVSTYVYIRQSELSSNTVRYKQLRYACLCEDGFPKNDTSFVFMPKGTPHGEIEQTEDVSDVLELKKKVMAAHRSQRKDAEFITTQLGSNIAHEHFYTFK